MLEVEGRWMMLLLFLSDHRERGWEHLIWLEVCFNIDLLLEAEADGGEKEVIKHSTGFPSVGHLIADFEEKVTAERWAWLMKRDERKTPTSGVEQ